MLSYNFILHLRLMAIVICLHSQWIQQPKDGGLLFVDATSMKMDFLPLGDVRTDPIIDPACLSDHIHTYYGASIMRPETTYERLRSAYGNSGNVDENLSLYWHPTVYTVDPDTGIHTKAPIYFSSAYYIWTTGEARAFPDGFKMIAGRGGDPLARAQAECVEQSDCKRSNCETDSTFFPQDACAELEVSMAFPTCWDGINIDSEDHQSHVSFDIDGGRFDGDCPASHPIKLPEIQFFFRIVPYIGGKHTFADGTGIYHSDYFSGWEQAKLQSVLDNCENESEAANPDAWCEDFVTFRDAPKEFGEDSRIVEKLKPLQPNPPLDPTSITEEDIDGVTTLPRGSCTGTLKPDISNPTAAPNATPGPTTAEPTTLSPISSPTVASSSPTTDDDCTLAGSSCFRQHKWAGCDEEICEEKVCDVKPQCCDEGKKWNNSCRNTARMICNICECSEERGDKFLQKKRKRNGKMTAVLKTCGWLSRLKNWRARQKLCRKSASFKDYDPARIVCPNTCKLGTCP